MHLFVIVLETQSSPFSAEVGFEQEWGIMSSTRLKCVILRRVTSRRRVSVRERERQRYQLFTKISSQVRPSRVIHMKRSHQSQHMISINQFFCDKLFWNYIFMSKPITKSAARITFLICVLGNSAIASSKPGWERRRETLTATRHNTFTGTQSTIRTPHRTPERSIWGLAPSCQDECRREYSVWTNFQIKNWMNDNGAL